MTVKAEHTQQTAGTPHYMQ